MIKQAFHPSGRTIKFSPENHLYVDDVGQTYTSVTTFIGQFFEKFDAESQAERCANGNNPKYKGQAPEEILAGWKAEGERGRTEGTNVHEYAESVFLGQEPVKAISPRCEKLFRQVEQMHVELRQRYKMVSAEMIVFDSAWGIAGTIDLLMWHPGQRFLIILDWKQNKEISVLNAYQKGKPPIDHCDDSDIVHYSLQLSLYELLIKRGEYFPDVAGVVRGIIHLRADHDTAKIIQLEDYSYEVKEMIKHDGRWS